MQEKRSTLPIFSFRDEILSLVEDNQIVIVSGETGWYVDSATNKVDRSVN
jgi:HrpA-like RNA helicase